MTNDPRHVAAFVAARVARERADAEAQQAGGDIIGADDARADAAHAGADVDLTHAQRDTDPTPTGAADAEADRERASH